MFSRMFAVTEASVQSLAESRFQFRADCGCLPAILAVCCTERGASQVDWHDDLPRSTLRWVFSAWPPGESATNHTHRASVARSTSQLGMANAPTSERIGDLARAFP